MSVDISKIKPGDEVWVRAEFVQLDTFGSPEVRVAAPGGKPSQGHVEPSAIVSHTPKALAVGDRVKGKAPIGCALTGAIVAIDGEAAWVRWTASTYDGSTDRRETWALANLERVDA